MIKMFTKSKSILTLKKIIRRLLRKSRQLFLSLKLEYMTDIETRSLSRQIIKPEYQKMIIPGVFDFSIQSEIKVKLKSLNLYKFENAIVTDNSDLIQVSNKIFWDKMKYEYWPFHIPLDSNLVSYNSNSVKILKPQRKIFIEKAFSMLGVHSWHWAHFLHQFLPKLILFLKEEESKQSISVLVSKPKDKNIIEIFNHFEKQHKNLTFIYIDEKVSAVCKTIYYIPSVNHLLDHANYMHPFYIEMRPLVSDLLNRFFHDYLDLYKQLLTNVNVYEKLYIIRRNTYRNILNYHEVEEWAISKGFKLIDPDKYELIEKIRIFSNAKVVMGAFSSGFTNILFSKEKTKVITLNSIQKSFENTMVGLNPNVEYINFLGTSVDDNIHSSFYIDLKKLNEFYEKFV